MKVQRRDWWAHMSNHQLDTFGPCLKGFWAGLRGDDPRCNPYDKLTREWRDWNRWHSWGVDLGQPDLAKSRVRGKEDIRTCSLEGTLEPVTKE